MSSPRIGSPSSIEAAATRSGSSECVVASTIARARRSGSSDLKIPEPTKLPSAPSCIVSAASAGVAIPPAQNSGTGSQPISATSRTTSSGARSSLASARQLLGRQRLQALDPADDVAQVAHGLDDVAGARLALGADHRRALGDPAQRLAEVGGAADERDLEGELVDVVGLVGGRQDLGLVDVVDLERLEDLRLGEVADPGLGHDRDRHRLLDLLDHRGVAHAGDAAVAADVGGNALERHHRDGAGVLGDARLLGVMTSMITPPLSISARPRLTRNVARSVTPGRIRERKFPAPAKQSRPAYYVRVSSRTAAEQPAGLHYFSLKMRMRSL